MTDSHRDQLVERDARDYAYQVTNGFDRDEKGNEAIDQSAQSDNIVDNYTSMNPEKGAVFDGLPEDLNQKVDVLPASDQALEKCEKAGLSSEEVNRIREIPNGEKPAPETYLKKDYIDDHLSKFEETGCYKIISEKRGEPTGTIGEGQNGVFVINGSDLNTILEKANGNPREIEKSLSMKPGYLGNNPYVIRCDNPQNLRMATGNEANAWQDEWCPAGTTRGGIDEAVIDPMEKGNYSYRHVFGNDNWKK